MKKIMKILLSFIILTVMIGTFVYAETTPVLNAYAINGVESEENWSLILYVDNPEDNDVKIYFGNRECENVDKKDRGLVRTLVLIDKSSSLAQYGDSIKELVKRIVASRSNGEVFTIATFDKEVQYLVENSGNYGVVQSKIASFEFNGTESYINNAIADAVEKLENESEIKYTRILLISDGTDENRFGITSEEVTELLSNARIPLYAAGYYSEEKKDNLTEIFKLARTSGGGTYHMTISGNDEQDEGIYNSVLTDVCSNIDSIDKITVIPPVDVCTGELGSVTIKLGNTEYTDENIKLPFVEQNIIEETIIKEPDDGSDDEKYPEPWWKKHLYLIVIGVVVLVVVAVVVVVIIIWVSSGKKADKKPVPGSGQHSPGAMPGAAPIDLSGLGHSSATVPLGRGATGRLGSFDGEKTDVIGGGPRTVKIRLQDIKDPMRTFEYPIRDRVIVGKNSSKCQIVIDYNRFVSNVHCEIRAKGAGFVVRDGADSVVASTNGTFVNDIKVAPEADLPSGSILKLGEVSFRVTYI